MTRSLYGRAFHLGCAMEPTTGRLTNSDAWGPLPEIQAELIWDVPQHWAFKNFPDSSNMQPGLRTTALCSVQHLKCHAGGSTALWGCVGTLCFWPSQPLGSQTWRPSLLTFREQSRTSQPVDSVSAASPDGQSQYIICASAVIPVQVSLDPSQVYLLLLQIFFLKCCLISHFFSKRARLFTISELASVTRISVLHHDTSPMSQPFLCTSRCYQWVAPPTQQLPAPCLLLCHSHGVARTIRKYNSEPIVFFIPDTKPPFHP